MIYKFINFLIISSFSILFFIANYNILCLHLLYEYIISPLFYITIDSLLIPIKDYIIIPILKWLSNGLLELANENIERTWQQNNLNIALYRDSMEILKPVIKSFLTSICIFLKNIWISFLENFFTFYNFICSTLVDTFSYICILKVQEYKDTVTHYSYTLSRFWEKLIFSENEYTNVREVHGFGLLLKIIRFTVIFIFKINMWYANYISFALNLYISFFFAIVNYIISYLVIIWLFIMEHTLFKAFNFVLKFMEEHPSYLNNLWCSYKENEYVSSHHSAIVCKTYNDIFVRKPGYFYIKESFYNYKWLLSKDLEGLKYYIRAFNNMNQKHVLHVWSKEVNVLIALWYYTFFYSALLINSHKLLLKYLNYCYEDIDIFYIKSPYNGTYTKNSKLPYVVNRVASHNCTIFNNSRSNSKYISLIFKNQVIRIHLRNNLNQSFRVGCFAHKK